MRPRVRRLLSRAFTIGLLLTALGAAGASPARADGESISGTVTAAADGSAVSGVIAEVYDGTGNLIADAVTDATGAYTVTGISALDTGYTVCFDASSATGSSVTGYQSQCYSGVPWDPDGGLPAGTTAVPVASGQAVTGIDAVLAADGGISGTVTATPGGAALSGVFAEVYDASGTFVAEAVTDASGDYTVTGLPQDATGYTVCFDGGSASGGPATGGFLSQCYSGVPWSPGSAPPAGATAVPISPGAIATGIDAVLTADGAISGTVTAADGTPLSGVFAQVYDASGNYLSGAATDASGDYSVEGLLPDSTGYTVCFDASSATGGSSVTGYQSQCYSAVPWDQEAGGLPTGTTAVPVASGQAATGIDASLAAQSGISGTVTTASGGTPMAGVTVRVFDTSNRDLAETVTGADGTYGVGLAPSATGYVVCFDATQATGGSSATGYASQCYKQVPWAGGFVAAAGATLVPVSSAAVTTGIDAQLTPAGAIAGTVRASDGTALGDVLVDVTDAAGNFVTQVSTDSAGDYTANGLAPSATGDTVCFDATDATGGPSTTGYSSQCDKGIPWTPGSPPPPGTTSVPVTAGTAASVDATLLPQAGISGTVTSASAGTALAGVQVRVFDAAGLYLVSTATDASGAYTVTGLAASSGGYIVCFDASALSYASQCDGKVPWAGGYIAPVGVTPVQLLSSGPVTLDAALQNQGGISGTVTASGSGLAGVTVDVYDPSGGFLTAATTGTDGSYAIAGLTAAKAGFGVCFDPSTAATATAYARQCYKNVPWSGGLDLPAGLTPAVVTAGKTTTGVDAALTAAGSIAGKVTAASGGGALAGVSVDVLDAAGNPVTSVVTDSAGHYSAAGLAALAYTVCFDATAAVGGSSATGYASQCYKNAGWLPGGPPPAGAKPVAVSAGKATTGITAALTAAGAITGKVTAASGGAGLAGVVVDLFDSSGNAVTSVSTDSSGAYSATGLASSAYTVCFDATGAVGGPAVTGYQDQCYQQVAWVPGNSPPGGVKPVSVSAGKAATGIGASLTAAGAISGTVTSGSGGGISGILADVYTSAGTYVTQGITDGAGDYSIAGLAPSATGYTVCFDTSGIASAGLASQCYQGVAWTAGETIPAGATRVPVTAGNTATGIGAVLATGGSVSGTVTAAAGGAGLAGVQVDVFTSGGAAIADTRTLPDGTFAVSGLPASAAGYALCFDASAAAGGTSKTGYASQCYHGVAWTGGPVPAGTTAITVKPGAAVTGIAVKLPAAGAISGTVTAKSGGAPLAGVTVRAYDGSGHLLAKAATGANGGYSLVGLAAAASDKVCFDASAASAAAGGMPKTGYASQCYKGVAWSGGATIPAGLAAVPVTAGATRTGVSAALLAGGSVSGTVTAAAGGAALVDVQVAVFDKSGNLIAAALTAANGSYTVSGLQPSAAGYAVCFEASFAAGGGSATGYRDQCYTSAAWSGAAGPPATAKRIPVSSGKAVSGVNVKLKNA